MSNEVSVRGETYEKLKKRAAEEGKSVPQLVTEWVEEALAANEEAARNHQVFGNVHLLR